jgi:MerR family transcriptional regulator, copper efflux regulator
MKSNGSASKGTASRGAASKGTTAAGSRTWSVGEAAARFGLGTNVLRHWEDMGLLQPARDAGGRRRYGEGELVRIGVILNSKAAGMGLDQIRTLLGGGSARRRTLLTSHVEELDGRIAATLTARAMAVHALECERSDVTTCPRFRAMVDVVTSDVSAEEALAAHRHTHLGPGTRRPPAGSGPRTRRGSEAGG